MRHTATDGVAGLSVWLLVTFMIPAKTAEPIEMPIGYVTRVRPTNDVLNGGSDSPKTNGQFWGLSGPLKSIVRRCCGEHSKKINNGISATAAADCTASDWPVSH